MFGDNPIEFRPSLEVNHFSSTRLWQSLIARIRCERYPNTATAEQESQLLKSCVLKTNLSLMPVPGRYLYSFADRHFDGNGDDSGQETTMKGDHECQRVVIRINKCDAIAGRQSLLVFAHSQFIQQQVRHFIRSRKQLP